MSCHHVRRLVAIFAVFLASAFSGPAGANTIIYVDDDAPEGGDGRSWETAYRYLQDALVSRSSAAGALPDSGVVGANAFGNVEIRVAQGLYKPDRNSEHPEGTRDRMASFELGNKMSLKGGFAGLGYEDPNAWDAERFVSTLSGDLAGDDIVLYSHEVYGFARRYRFEPTRRENAYIIISGVGMINISGLTTRAAEVCALGVQGELQVRDCVFDRHNAAISYSRYRHHGSHAGLSVEDCLFRENWSSDGVVEADSLHIKDSRFERNDGIAIRAMRQDLLLEGCLFLENTARSELGIIAILGSEAAEEALLEDCRFYGNLGYCMVAWDATRTTLIRNCIFSGDFVATFILNHNGTTRVLNSTFVRNYDVGYWRTFHVVALRGQVFLNNCILWGLEPHKDLPSLENLVVTHCLSRVALSGAGNIQGDPLFVDADGPDDVIGTEDDDLRPLPNSPCINSGDNSMAATSLRTDIAGRPRVLGVVDMGAHEQGRVWHVDAAGGSDDNNGETGLSALRALNHAVNLAGPGDLVLLQPGLYRESVDLSNRMIALQGSPGPKGIAVIQAQDDTAIRLSPQAGPKTVLKNLVIRNSQTGILVEQGQPVLRNLTLVGNEVGIAARPESEPKISNCILWRNQEADLVGCQASYSCIERPAQASGTGNLSLDPLFADIDAGDFHLRSLGGRFSPVFGTYIRDSVSSPCIDAGSPHDWPGTEPRPNGQRVNMGAYGGTYYASLSQGTHPILEILSVGAHSGYVGIGLHAWDPDGEVVAIRCTVNGVDLGLAEKMDNTWHLARQVDPAESYLVTAFAVDDAGNVTAAEPMSVPEGTGGRGRGR